MRRMTTTLPRLLLLLRVVHRVSGRVNQLPQPATRAAPRSSSSSVSSSSSLASSSSANNRRPLSPTAARTPRKLRAHLATFLESQFRTLLLFLLLVDNADEILRLRDSQTRQAEWISLQTRIWRFLPILEANKSSLMPSLIFLIHSTVTPETWTNPRSLLRLQTRIRMRAMFKGALPKAKEYSLSQNQGKDTSHTVVENLTSISSAKSSVS